MPVKREDLTGRVFGGYTVLSFYNSGSGSTEWLCNYKGNKVIKSRKFLLRQNRLTEEIEYKNTYLIGKKFNSLTILSLDHVDNRGHRHWLCKCDCGNVKEFEEYLIISGKRTSCGCEGRKSIAKHNIKNDLSGKKFGRLTALYYAGNNKWHCKCKCGVEKDIARSSLVNGLTKSCGCYHNEVRSNRLIDLTGKKFNMLTVIGLDHINKQSFWKCKCDCGNGCVVSSHHLTRGHTQSCGCLDVAHRGSKAELEIKTYIESLVGYTINKTKRVLDGKEIDMYIEELKFGIEYNGSVFHATKGGVFKDMPKLYHGDKFLTAKDKGVHLLSIFDVDWDNNQDKIKMYIHSILVPATRLFARKCEVRTIDKKLADDFTDEYHIQGKARTNSINYGLYYNDELYAVMSFGKLRMSKTEVGQYELHRYCVKDGYTIIGGANKLLKAFEREYSPKYIRSYSDNDYFLGGIYERLGFDDVCQCTPRYYWYLNGAEIKREDCMLKHLKVEYPELLQEAYDVNTSNKEDYVMLKLGACKVYRSGNTKWEKTY